MKTTLWIPAFLALLATPAAHAQISDKKVVIKSDIKLGGQAPAPKKADPKKVKKAENAASLLVDATGKAKKDSAEKAAQDSIPNYKNVDEALDAFEDTLPPTDPFRKGKLVSNYQYNYSLPNSTLVRKKSFLENPHLGALSPWQLDSKHAFNRSFFEQFKQHVELQLRAGKGGYAFGYDRVEHFVFPDLKKFIARIQAEKKYLNDEYKISKIARDGEYQPPTAGGRYRAVYDRLTVLETMFKDGRYEGTEEPLEIYNTAFQLYGFLNHSNLHLDFNDKQDHKAVMARLKSGRNTLYDGSEIAAEKALENMRNARIVIKQKVSDTYVHHSYPAQPLNAPKSGKRAN